MSTLKHQRSVTWLPPGQIEKSSYELAGAAKTPNGPALRYSSPWPWVLALALSITIWLAAAWLFWTFA
jgi:hypothetical protein